jgi:hypothetical protein
MDNGRTHAKLCINDNEQIDCNGLFNERLLDQFKDKKNVIVILKIVP